MIDLWQDKYILLYPSGCPVALDEPSGGYPYPASHPKRVQFWGTLEEAVHYRNSFLSHNFSVHRVTGLTVTAEKYNY